MDFQPGWAVSHYRSRRNGAGVNVRKRTEDILADHATTFVDQDGDTRCDCGKWLESGEHEWPQHVAWMLDDADLLAVGVSPSYRKMKP